MRDYLGTDSLTIVEPTPGEMTKHIDMYAKLLNDTLFIVAEYENPEDGWPGDYERLNELAAELDALQNMDGRDFEVARIPLLPLDTSGPYRVSKTYTNALIVNELVLVPIYEHPLDETALQLYRDLMPGYEVVGIDSRFIIEYLGAVHCTTNCIHASNPLMIFHEPLVQVNQAESPWIDCRLNPKFATAAVTVHFRSAGAMDWTPLPAVLGGGIWRAQLPPMSEDFEYYIAAQAQSGDAVFPAFLPRGAPMFFYTVDVWDATSASPPAGPPLQMSVRPNPFNPATVLHVDVPRAGRVDLGIYDVAGRLQRVLIDGEWREAGSHAVRFDGRSDAGRALPSGVYLARLRSDGKSRQERLVLLK
jgi:hypothetical protein